MLIMKKLFVLFLLLHGAALSLTAQGIVFQTGSWSDIMAKAKAEKKLIFLDAYASWCGPCKMMARQTFTHQDVGAYYNATFVNAKIDMETGEGPGLSAQYGVQAYPTLLFINGDGQVVHRALGYQDVAQFLALGKKASDPANNLLALETRYSQGERSPEFVLAYLDAQSAVGSPTVDAVALEYLNSQKDWSTDQNLEVIMLYVNDPYAKPYAYFTREKARFVAKFGEDAVSEKSGQVFQQYLQTHDNLSMADIEALIGLVFPDEKDRIIAVFRMRHYLQTGEINQFAQAAVAYFDSYPSENPEELNQVAWLFYEQIDDAAQLKKALGWALRSVEIQEVYANQDTVAALYFKLGDKKNAETHALRAIELAKASGEDYSSTEALLQKIRE